MTPHLQTDKETVENETVKENTTKTVKANKTKKERKITNSIPLVSSNFETSSTNGNLNVLAATIAASSTTSSILAAATKATKKIASETVKKASKVKSKSAHKSDELSIDEYFYSFLPNSTSISTLLLGLDYIFYVWTLVLILIVGYLTYYQHKQSKQTGNQQQQPKLTNIELIVKFVVLFIVKPIYFGFIFLFDFIWNNVFSKVFKPNVNQSNIEISSSISNGISNSLNDSAAYAWLNNCFKWFYFSPDTTKTINASILETLNSVKTQMGQSLQMSAKQQLKFDEIFFKSVDTLPPKFSNIQTVVNATDNLTLKANIEFGNIDTKIEFKKSRRLYDLKLTKARAQITVVLSQKNQVLTLECSVDPQSEFLIAFEKNPNIEPDIMQYLETLIQTAAKLTILNLELNSSSKSQNVNSSKVFKTTKPMAPQINQGLKGSSPAPATTASAVPLSTSATNFNTNVSPTATNKMTFSSLVADKNILNVPSSATTPSSAPALAPVQQQEPAPVQTQLLSASAAGATSPAQSSQNEFLNNILQNNLANNNNNAINTNNTDINETFYQPDYFHDYPVSKPYEELQQTENAYSENPEVSNIQAMAAAAAAVNAKQLRNAVNEKRLLVRLLKATNLTNCEEPYIVVELDYPMQKHITDIHRDMSSINEQFFFDIIANSEELTFSIFDRAKDYGNDLVGEAAMPVSDLCSSPNGKRVIQLHRYGQTKTGSITAEFVFIEPSEHSDHHESRMMRSTGQQSRGSVSPYDQNRNTLSPERRMLYRDEMMTSQQADQFQEQQTNPDMFSEGQYSPRNQAINMQTQQHRSRAQAQPLQQQPQQSTLGRVINRNYLQTQSQNYRAKTLDARGSTEFAGIDMVDPNEMPTLDKRKRSISRSLKSLFNRSISSTSKIFGNKRDKSYDVPSNENEVYDTHSVDHSSKKIGSSIKKLFASKKKGSETEINKMGQQQQQRMGGGPAISISSYNLEYI